MRLVLTVQEVRPLGEQLPTDNIGAATTELTIDSHKKAKKPKKNTLRHNVYWYGPADLELTAEDFGRKGRRIGRVELDPEADALEQDFDLTDIVVDGGLESIGIRIQSAMDHAQPGGSDDEDQNEDGTEGEAAASRATARNATAFLLTLHAVAD